MFALSLQTAKAVPPSTTTSTPTSPMTPHRRQRRGGRRWISRRLMTGSGPLGGGESWRSAHQPSSVVRSASAAGRQPPRILTDRVHRRRPRRVGERPASGWPFGIGRRGTLIRRSARRRCPAARSSIGSPSRSIVNRASARSSSQITELPGAGRRVRRRQRHDEAERLVRGDLPHRREDPVGVERARCPRRRRRSTRRCA